MAEPILSHAPRFLVVRGGAIGDFIVTLPVLQALRAQWPHAVIEIWGYPHIAQLAVAGGWADSVVSLDRADMARFFVPNPEFSESQVATIRSFDLIFNYLHDAVGQVRSNFLLAGARQVISGSPIIKAGHAIPFLLEPLQASLVRTCRHLLPYCLKISPCYATSQSFPPPVPDRASAARRPSSINCSPGYPCSNTAWPLYAAAHSLSASGWCCRRRSVSTTKKITKTPYIHTCQLGR